MTAPLYVRDGSRFVVYDPRRQHTPPIPTPVPVLDDVDERPNVTRVPAPRCQHGSFARWAVRNCCAPKESRRAR